MIKLSFNNVLLGGSFTASSNQNLVDNLQMTSPSKSWHTSNPYTGVHTLAVTYPSSTVSCFGVFNMVTNVDAMINVKIKLGNTVVKELNFLGENIVYGYGEGPYGIFAYGGYAAPGRAWMQKFRVIWFEDVVSDNVLITITNAPEFSLGYIHLGTSWSPCFGINKDYSSSFIPITTDVVRNLGGISTGTISRNYRAVKLSLQLLTGQEVQYLLNNHNSNTPVIVSAFGSASSTEAVYGTLLGKIPEGISYVGAPHRRFSAANMTIEELK